MSKLASFIEIKPRFSRSINIERDRTSSSLDGYVITGRALDVIKRIGQGFRSSHNGMSFSITGPHGGGKSSLALLVRSLTSDVNSPEYKEGLSLVENIDPYIANGWHEAFSRLTKNKGGFAHCFVTASREPVRQTILRALELAITTDSRIETKEKASLRKKLESGDRGIVEVVSSIAKEFGLALVIDEFGKNLEAFVDSPSDGDLFLLQSLAELSSGEDHVPLLLITLQHLSFDEYVHGVSSAQKKEWAKVQGRFQDIPFIESNYQSRKLIASVFKARNPSIAKRYKSWLVENFKLLENAGLAEFVNQPETRATYPLHPLSLASLPYLCSRYGQNERTLFSFLTSHSSHAIPLFLERQNYSNTGPLPFVGLDLIYDYFVESSTNSIVASSTVNRWMEIESRIRDAQGLSELELTILKSIGILNLVSSGGSLRASSEVLKLAILTDTSKSIKTEVKKLEKCISNLERRGLIVYRGFADEYRIWQGSDFDLRLSIEQARRSTSARRHVDLLSENVSLNPVIAGRSSQQFGILRVFKQKFFYQGMNKEMIDKEIVDEAYDGLILYVDRPDIDFAFELLEAIQFPTLVLVGEISNRFQDLILETSSLDLVLKSDAESKIDWVARRELIERLMFAKRSLISEISKTWYDNGDWKTNVKEIKSIDRSRGLSSALSSISDVYFTRTPRIANEMISRRELTAQGARARRSVIESLFKSANEEYLGISGYGPDRAIYEAIFLESGIHKKTKKSHWEISKPTENSWVPIWQELENVFISSVERRISLQILFDRLSSPPYGLKGGLIPLIVTAFILNKKSQLALYEHGTLLLELDEPSLERLVKNPRNFALRNYGLSSPYRLSLIENIIKEFKITNTSAEDGFVNVIKALYREILGLSELGRKTKELMSEKAQKVRKAFFDANEPDSLLFQELPIALGQKPFSSNSKKDDLNIVEFTSSLKNVVIELQNFQKRLHDFLAKEIHLATSTSSDLVTMRDQLSGQAANLDGKVIGNSLRSFVTAIQRKNLSDYEWLDNLAMVALEGKPTKTWSDEDLIRFSLRIKEIGGTLKRLQALLYDRLAAQSESFDAVRVTITRPDGTELARVLTISEAEKSFVDKAAKSLINEIARDVGSQEEARTLLLAFLSFSAESQDPELELDRRRDLS